MDTIPRPRMEDFLCDFLNRMINKTDDREEVGRAVDALNESLYEFGGELSIDYNHRDGAASIKG